MTLVIGRTWDGVLLPDAERTSLRLDLDDDALHIQVDAPFAGDAPPPGEPGVTDRLWEHEVVELFVAGADDHYTEIELGPHGHHLGLRLEGVRQPIEVGFPIHFEAIVAGARWTGAARVPRDRLPARPVRCNAYRIGGGRHEALVSVPGATPDFHRLDRFVPWPL